MYTCLPKQKPCYRKQLQTCMSNQIKIDHKWCPVSSRDSPPPLPLLRWYAVWSMRMRFLVSCWLGSFILFSNGGPRNTTWMVGASPPVLPSLFLLFTPMYNWACLPEALVSWSVGIKRLLIFIIHQNCLLGAQVLRLCVCLCVALVPWYSLFVWSAFQFPI